MAKPKKLKVFRTPIGFHDAYVAAPSQKAALEAWGSESNLFAAGVAEVVTDAKLTKEPLERPGEVIRKLRGSADEHIKALGKTAKKGRKDRPSPQPSPARGRGSKKRAPKPSRAALDKAEAALERAEERHGEALAKIRAEEQAIAERRRELERKQREERDRLRRTAEDELERYRAAMDDWSD